MTARHAIANNSRSLNGHGIIIRGHPLTSHSEEQNVHTPQDGQNLTALSASDSLLMNDCAGLDGSVVFSDLSEHKSGR